jgi:DNA-binding transcriptional ArsR family regulator
MRPPGKSARSMEADPSAKAIDTEHDTENERRFTSIEVLKAIRESNLDAKCKGILSALASYIHFRTGEAWPSINSLALGSGYTRRTVERAMKELRNLGIIEDVRRSRGGARETNVIRLNLASLRRCRASIAPDQRDTDPGTVTPTPLHTDADTPTENAENPVTVTPEQPIEQAIERTTQPTHQQPPPRNAVGVSGGGGGGALASRLEGLGLSRREALRIESERTDLDRWDWDFLFGSALEKAKSRPALARHILSLPVDEWEGREAFRAAQRISVYRALYNLPNVMHQHADPNAERYGKSLERVIRPVWLTPHYACIGEALSDDDLMSTCSIQELFRRLAKAVARGHLNPKAVAPEAPVTVDTDPEDEAPICAPVPRNGLGWTGAPEVFMA